MPNGFILRYVLDLGTLLLVTCEDVRVQSQVSVEISTESTNLRHLSWHPVFDNLGTLQRPKHKILGPAATAIYCLPSTIKVMGEAFMKMLVGNRQSVFPFR